MHAPFSSMTSIILWTLHVFFFSEFNSITNAAVHTATRTVRTVVVVVVVAQGLQIPYLYIPFELYLNFNRMRIQRQQCVMPSLRSFDWSYLPT